MMRKAYLYMRFSSAEQADGHSLLRQRSLADEYVTRHPEKLIEIVEDVQFVDEGVSSFAGQNLQPGRALHRFLERVEDGTVAPGSILMVESLDRLSRQEIIQAQRLLLDIILRGISVVTTSPAESREYDGRSGLHDLIISLAGMERANRESAIKSDRVRRAWKRKKETASTLKLTKRSPSWLSLSDDRKSFALVDNKVKVVRRIFALADSLGQQSIARVLNQEGIAPFQATTSGWHSSSIVKILSNPAVIGVYQPHTLGEVGGKKVRVHDGAAVADYYPAIIDEATFYRVQALRISRKQHDGGRKGKQYTNIFGGIAKCASCGSPMVVINKGVEPKGGKYLVCSSARRGLGCRYRSVRYKPCEKGFLLYCQRVDISEVLPGNVRNSEATKLRKLQSTLLGEASQKRGVIEKMLAAIRENGGAFPKAIQNQMVEYEARIDDIERQLLEVSTGLAALEHESHRIAGMQTMFHELLRSLDAASETERYVLRSRLHAALKTAIATISVGEPKPKDVTAVGKAIADARGHYLEHLGQPGHPDYSASPELEAYPPIKGGLTSFRVHYRNGNTYELFVDSREAIAGRLKFTAAAALEAAARGVDIDRVQSLQLMHGYGVRERFVPPRRTDGKFATAKRSAKKVSGRTKDCPA